MKSPSAPMRVWSHTHVYPGELAACSAIHPPESPKSRTMSHTVPWVWSMCIHPAHPFKNGVSSPPPPSRLQVFRSHASRLHVQIAYVQIACPNHHAPTRANVCRSPSCRHDTPRHPLIASAKHAFYMQRRFVHTLHSFTLLPLVHTVVPISFNNGCFKHILCRSFIASGPLPR